MKKNIRMLVVNESATCKILLLEVKLVYAFTNVFIIKNT